MEYRYRDVKIGIRSEKDVIVILVCKPYLYLLLRIVSLRAMKRVYVYLLITVLLTVIQLKAI